MPLRSEKAKQEELFAAILRLGDSTACRKFFTDLCTPAELRAFADRWQVAKLVAAGVPYRKIYEQTGVSTATVTRVSRSLSEGAGGYKLALGAEGATDV